MTRRCQHVRPDGSSCKATAQPGGFCFWHDPAAAERRRQAQSAGGKTRCRPRATLGPNVPDVDVSTLAELRVLLVRTVNQVRRGELDTRAGNCVGYLGSVLHRVLLDSQLEARVAALEAALQARGGAA